MPTFFARGRIAWICAMALGLVLFIIGMVQKPIAVWAATTGAAFVVFGMVFLILSFVTHGATD